MDEERERAQKQFPVVLICLAAVKQGERLDEGLLRGVGTLTSLQTRRGRRHTGGRLLVVTGAAAGAVVDIRSLIGGVDGLGNHVGVERSIAAESRLGAEEEHCRKHNGAKDGLQVKGPPPADAVSNFANDDRGEEGTAKDGQVRESHARAALMDEVQVTDSGIDQGLKGGTANALDDAGAEQRVIVRAYGAGPGG